MSIRELYELQELDWVRAERRQAFEETLAELADESALDRARRRVAELDAEFTRQNALRRDAQLAVDQIEGREETVQGRLYSGGVTNPRELAAMQEEQAMLQRQRTEAEDILLERMVATEELTDELDAERRSLAQLDAHRSRRVPVLRQRERELATELETLNRRRLELLPQFSPQLLSTYETLMASRGAHAVSKVESARGREICGACRVALPRSDVQGVRSGGATVQCNNCRRILYME